MPIRIAARRHRGWIAMRLAVGCAVLTCAAFASQAQDDSLPTEQRRAFDQRFSQGRGSNAGKVEQQRYTSERDSGGSPFAPRFPSNRGPGSGSSDQRPPFPRGPGSSAPFESAPIDSGFVFLDGKYVAPPYVVRTDDGNLFINGQQISGALSPTGQSDRGWGTRWEGSRESRSQRLADELENGYVVVAFADQRLISLDDVLMKREFLRVITAGERRSEVLDSLVKLLPSNIDDQVLTSWLNDFTPPLDLVERAKAEVAAYDAVEESNRKSIAATRRIDKLSYPMTVLGMMLSVFAVGHVLIARPTGGDTGDAAELTPKALRSVVISILLILALSGLDLIWTILAWQAGQMRELNPLGSQLLQNPPALIAFKTIATLLAAGLLFALRRHRSAQYGAWWLCLLLTILAFRWLTFNSLFVS